MERIVSYLKKKSFILTEYYSWCNVIQAVYDTDQIPKYKDKNLKT